MPIKITRTISGVRRIVSKWQSDGKKVALVPTMGGLHEGHLSLVSRAEKVADHVVVSLFVNPTQFNNPDDLETYPGNEKDDLAALRKTGTDVLFAPKVSEMYPEGFATEVKVTAATGILCDAHRPGHFAGVATVVSKLFLQTGADMACFGEKDYQQLFIIRRMVKDLDIPIRIIPVKTVREKDGLALSSRNARLSVEDRAVAPRLHAALRQARKAVLDGVNHDVACARAIEILEEDGDFKVEYFETRSEDTLDSVDLEMGNMRLFAAAWLGKVRLIDNLAVK